MIDRIERKFGVMAGEQKSPMSPAQISVSASTLALSPKAGNRQVNLPHDSPVLENSCEEGKQKVWLWEDSQVEGSLIGVETVEDSMDPTSPKKADLVVGKPVFCHRPLCVKLQFLYICWQLCIHIFQ